MNEYTRFIRLICPSAASSSATSGRNSPSTNLVIMRTCAPLLWRSPDGIPAVLALPSPRVRSLLSSPAAFYRRHCCLHFRHYPVPRVMCRVGIKCQSQLAVFVNFRLAAFHFSRCAATGTQSLSVAAPRVSVSPPGIRLSFSGSIQGITGPEYTALNRIAMSRPAASITPAVIAVASHRR